ncbi:hypothetical protein GDO81_011949 [Engystomops pustulosus]|uniref:Uncharacterized protein n=1 Tax=Engystomops pustulosus TaxID=76066 RepID=A0AAV7BI56_ENGPU|nr:hypothetical protein GDO81_011949 [Engystomops pustulosus]
MEEIVIYKSDRVWRWHQQQQQDDTCILHYNFPENIMCVQKKNCKGGTSSSSMRSESGTMKNSLAGSNM